MKLIIGLGNPGEKYKNNRHNVGFMVIDKLAQKLGIEDWELNGKFLSEIVTRGLLILGKPQTFMNSSGRAVSLLASFYKIPTKNIYIIHDDLDIPLGEYKIQFGVGPKVHNGINSINKSLGTCGYWRVRIGVDNRRLDNKIPGEDYVLQDFDSDEKKTLEEVIKRVLDNLDSRRT